MSAELQNLSTFTAEFGLVCFLLTPLRWCAGGADESCGVNFEIILLYLFVSFVSSR